MKISSISNFNYQQNFIGLRKNISFGCTGGLGDIFPDSFTPLKPDSDEDRTIMRIKVKRFSAERMNLDEKNEEQLADMAEYFGGCDDFFVKLYCVEAYGNAKGTEHAKKIIPYVQRIREYKKEASALLLSLNLKKLSDSKNYILGKSTLSNEDKEKYEYIQKELQRLKEKEDRLHDEFTKEVYEDRYC